VLGVPVLGVAVLGVAGRFSDTFGAIGSDTDECCGISAQT